MCNCSVKKYKRKNTILTVYTTCGSCYIPKTLRAINNAFKPVILTVSKPSLFSKIKSFLIKKTSSKVVTQKKQI